MPYAKGRSDFDADSHIMERPDFVRDFAEAAFRDRLRPLDGSGQGKTSKSWHEVVKRPGDTPQRVAERVALDDDLIAGPKGYLALGAFNREERARALDQLGFARQLVSATFGAAQAFEHEDVEIAYSAARERFYIENFMRIFG